MIQKKICLLGSFSVGKTSLAARFVQSLFSEKYHTTVGVKIDKKVVRVRQQEVMLMIWDLAGEDAFNRVELSYLRGSSGYLLVVDGTRHATLDVAFTLQQKVEGALGSVPFILLLNKADLTNEWELGPDTMAQISSRNWTFLETSAKTGAGVEEAFHTLAEKMIGG